MPADLEGAEPDVIAEYVTYLISEKAHFTTGKKLSLGMVWRYISQGWLRYFILGQTFNINGGQMCDWKRV